MKNTTIPVKFDKKLSIEEIEKFVDLITEFSNSINTNVTFISHSSIAKKYYKYVQCKECINDYDDPQMCKFCKNGDRQTLCQ